MKLADLSRSVPPIRRHVPAGCRAPVVGLVAAVMFLAPGCQRAFYREQATSEAYGLIAEKNAHPHWSLPDFDIAIDPASRMFDPFDPDYEPMPVDDPASHALMHCVDGKRGFPHWHDNGVTPFVESPFWLEYLPLSEEGVLVLSRERSVRLALIHSTDYQEEFEELFLSALDVSAERFRFDAQFFGGYEAFYDVAGREAIGSSGDDISLLTLNTRDIQVQKAFITGADLVVGLANSLIWQFSGPDTHSATTIVDFALIQPLLRRAGRDRIMETLTLAERSLLANVRQLERFRRGFQLNIVTGTGEQAGASRRGGFFGGSGLTGFTGVGGGGFGRVGGTGGGGGGNVGAAQAGGFLGLLQDLQNIRNLEDNITALRNSVAKLEAQASVGLIDALQVDQARQDLFERQSELLNARNAYQNALDSFKIELGLPPQLEIRIQDPMLDPFQLIDPATGPLQRATADRQQLVGDAILGVLPLDDLDAQEVVWSEEVATGLRLLLQYLQEIEADRQRLRELLRPRVLADIDELERSLPRRRQDLSALRERLRNALEGEEVPTGLDVPGYDVFPALLSDSNLQRLPSELRERLETLMERLDAEDAAARQVAADLQDLLDRGPTLPPDQLYNELVSRMIPVQLTLSGFSDSLLEMILIQARARTQRITLVPVEMDSDTAFEIARVYRRDWMNARANLVDQWRLIEFNADNLESDLDIVFSGDIANTGDNPIRLRDVAGSLRVGVQFDAPFTRLLERNVYRESLIEYQQSRRSYYRFVDGVSAGLRQILRQIELNQVNFELRRAAVEVAVRQVEFASLRLQEPREPGERAPTAARDLVDALSSLRRAQDAFLSVWVNYEVQRRRLDLDLGTMRLDEEGIWIDPGPIGLTFGYPDEAELAAFAQEMGLYSTFEPPEIELIEPGTPAPGRNPPP